ncbi:AraC family transcriptional regulator [Paucibacter sp. R3-3]|uniref:AraC family transcriptional regulator n=1 Tax=Roseateles agri TaxID=3098619 RepID=A0ABU5DN93_9BURK|nr:AraC family transcriptional regulator [Paucibacter sp. R3-3]MDY0747787.1 AraC family transcriptional regulator [Paucibacter sp. R3-3]
MLGDLPMGSNDRRRSVDFEYRKICNSFSKIQMTGDPFSDVLDLIHARSVVSGGLIAGGDWAIRFPASDRINFWCLVRGQCWCAIDGGDAPFLLSAGDFLLRRSPRSAVLATDLSLAPIDLEAVTSAAVGGISRHGQGEEFFMMGGKVDFDAVRGASLMDALPASIRIPQGSAHAAVLQLLLAQLVRERSDALPGMGAASAQLAHLLFIQVLRAHMDEQAEPSPGWLRLLGNRRLAPAVRLMHGDPARAWALEELAEACGMSRASFAAHFKASAGLAPLAYLTRWRMRLAERDLREGQASVASIGYALGYSSESAFSNAFKRVVGQAPAHYRAGSPVSGRS